MDKETQPIRTRDLLGAIAIAALGVVAVRYLMTHPDEANRVYMKGCLITKRTTQKFSDAFQIVADHAGTEYNKRRSYVS